MNALYPLTRRLTAALVGALALIGLATPAQAQASCDTGSAAVNIDVNNVQATLYNIGGLFWRGSGARYEVPKNSGLQSIFASGIWVGGEVDGELRFAGSTYGPWEYWPGPLTAAGTVDRATCQTFDRFWKVNIGDIRAYNSDGTTAGDLASWPIAFGAPFFVDTNGDGRRNAALDADEDGNPDEPRIELQITDPGYGTRQLDLAGGERPDIIGDQGIWWVMNDKGGSHDWSETTAIGLEVRALAFGFSTADALNNTTFYRYQFIYRGTVPLTNTYIGIFSDPDLGDATDDYVGSDPELGLGYVYNGDSNDENGYGTTPPALGYDFFQGPLVGGAEGFNDGLDNDGDGEVDEEGERLAIEKFFYFTNGGTVTSDPGVGEEAYSYMQGLWKDGTPFKEGGDGYNTNGPQVDFAFPGDPPRFWSEYNVDGTGRANNPADRRFGVSSGPFTFQPGQTQEIVFGIIWSQAQGATVQPQIVSVRQLKFDDRTVQAAFNADFSLPEPPPAVDVVATGLDQEIILEWDSVTGNLSDIFRYEVDSPFAPDAATDRTYNFEGFKIIQYRGPADQNGTLVATFDVNNNVTTVIDEGLDPLVGEVVTVVQAQGSDNGTATDTPTSISITTDIFTNGPLRNGTSYYYGIQPYAVNEASTGQKVFAAPVTRIEVRPTLVGGVVTTTTTGSTIEGVSADNNVGGGSFGVEVFNPAVVTGDTYSVSFFRQNDADGNNLGTNYRITNNGTGEVVFDGANYFNEFGELPPQRTAAVRAEGLLFNVQGPADAITEFLVTDNAGGPVNPPTGGAADFGGYPVPVRPGAEQQVANAIWLFSTGGRQTFDDFISRATRDGGNSQYIFPKDFEMRFTGTSIAAKDGIFAQVGADVEVPFELWDIGIGTPDDPSDDVRLIPIILDIDDDGTYNLSALDSPLSGAANDPETDWIYWYTPLDETPGESGYLAYENGGAVDAGQINHEVFARTTLVGWNLGTAPPYALPYPEAGTVFRIVTAKPNQPGDSFTVDTSPAGAIPSNTLSADDQDDRMDLISITPNPYRGFSGYETSGNESIARFVNLPAQATIRIFTLSGTLVRTIEKNSPTATIDWNLKTEANLPVASGMYLIHVQAREADGAVIGERILKFGVIQRRVQLDVL